MSAPAHQLERGKALVIVGPEGSGKSVLARSIAMHYGKFQEVELGVNFDFQLRDALNGRVKTLIIDGEPSDHDRALLKSLITSPATSIRVPFSKTVRTVPTPHLIFCSGSTDWLGDSDRRFTIVHADKQGMH